MGKRERLLPKRQIAGIETQKQGGKKTYRKFTGCHKVLGQELWDLDDSSPV